MGPDATLLPNPVLKHSNTNKKTYISHTKLIKLTKQ